MLSDDERARIHAEEIFRHEVRNGLKKDERQTVRRGAWGFLNSTFGLWFLSTCVVGAISFLYTNHAESVRKEEAAAKESHQQRIDAANRNATMVTTLLPHLSSEDQKKQQLAIAVAKYLKLQGELPGELESVLEQIVQSTGEPPKSPEDVQRATRDAAAAAIDAFSPPTMNASKTTVPIAQIATLPPRVYIQIGGESQRGLATTIQTALRQKGFIAPGVENVGAKAPKTAEIRYFHEEDQAEASQIVQVLKDNGVAVNPDPQLLKIKSAARPRHYEVWFESVAN